MKTKLTISIDEELLPKAKKALKKEKTMNKYFTIILTLAYFLCGSVGFCHSQPLNEAPKIIKVGMLLPLSGNYSSIGEDTRHGIEIALNELGSTQLKPVYGDSRTEPTHAINEFRKMLNSDDVLAVFTFRSPIGMALNPVSKQEKIALLGGVGNKDFARNNEYAFQLWPPSDQEGEFVARHILEMGPQRIALVTAEDDWTVSVSESLRDELKKRSSNIVFDKEFIPTEMDFGFVITKLKLAKPDVVFVNLSMAQIGVFITKLRQYGVDSRIVSNFWISKPDVLKSIGSENLDGIRFAEISNSYPKLERELKDKFGSKPSAANISAYVATMFLGQAAKNLGEKPDRREYYQKLSETKSISTVNGVFAIHNRVVKFPLTMRVFSSDVVTELKP